MLTAYFKRPTTLAAYYAGAAGPYLDSFSDWLVKRGYGSDAIRHLMLGAADFANWAQATGGSLTALPVGVWNAFCEHLAKQSRLHGAKGQHSIYWRGAKQFAEYLCAERGIVIADRTARALPELIVEFECWMQTHRGVKPSTLKTYRRHAIELLSTLSQQSEPLTAARLHAFILAYSKHHGCAIAKTRVQACRMFLRFLIATERCQPDLDAAIPNIAQWRLATLPKYLAPADVERILAGCNGARPIDLRDRAILLLLARLGLRASEVADLKLGDIDWSHGTFAVIGKSRREARLPLPQDVGDAILSYLRHARPHVHCDHVFISAVAPWTPITRDTIKHAVSHAIRRAGVEAPSFGPHILRHSAATGLLRQGASLQVIGEVLRHRSIDTTALYAKVDVGLLHQVATPWPGETSC